MVLKCGHGLSKYHTRYTNDKPSLCVRYRQMYTNVYARVHTYVSVLPVVNLLFSVRF